MMKDYASAVESRRPARTRVRIKAQPAGEEMIDKEGLSR